MGVRMNFNGVEEQGENVREGRRRPTEVRMQSRREGKKGRREVGVRRQEGEEGPGREEGPREGRTGGQPVREPQLSRIPPSLPRGSRSNHLVLTSG